MTKANEIIKNVANKLSRVGHPHAAELMRISQWAEQELARDPQQFDPQQFDGFDPEAREGREGTNVDPNYSESNPAIEPFVNMKRIDNNQVEDRVVHTCTVVFKAPTDVAESDMMNYVLGIGDELGVDVESFKWTKSDPKSREKTV